MARPVGGLTEMFSDALDECATVPGENARIISTVGPTVGLSPLLRQWFPVPERR